MVPHELILSQHGATAYTDLLDAFLALFYVIFVRFCLMKIRYPILQMHGGVFPLSLGLWRGLIVFFFEYSSISVAGNVDKFYQDKDYIKEKEDES